MTRVALFVAAVALSACSSEESAVAPSRAPVDQTPDASSPDGGGEAPQAAPTLRGIEFGSIDCGANQRGAIGLPNRSSTPLTWSASVQPTDYFAIEGVTSGVVGANDIQILTVRAEAVARKVSPGQTVHGVVRIETDDARQKVIELPVTFVPEGARIEAPARVDFGVVPAAAPAPVLTTRIRNTGSRSVVIPLAGVAAGPFSLQPSDPLADLNAGDEVDVPIAFRPDREGAFQEVLPLRLRGTVCGDTPLPLAVAASSYGGAVGVSPGSLELDATGCGQTPTGKTITITNYGKTDEDWSAALVGPQQFVATPEAGSVPAGGTATFTVTRTAGTATPGAITDTLHVTVAGYRIPIAISHETVGPLMRGVGGDAFTMPDQRLKTSGSAYLDLVNDGNSPANVAPTVVGDFAVGPGPYTVAPFGGLHLQVTFSPTNLGPRDGTLSLGPASSCGSRDVALHGYGFARATGVWGNRTRDYNDNYYGPPHYCFELDDGGLFCDGAFVGYKPAGATLLPDLLGSSYCLVPSGSSVPLCDAPLTPQPLYTGWLQSLAGLVARGGDVQYWNGTASAGLTDVVRLGGLDSMPCVVRKSGVLECWGGYSIIPSLTSDVTSIENRVAIPNVSDAVDVAGSRSYVYNADYSYRDHLWVLHASGAVSHITSDGKALSTETLGGITDAVELLTRSNLLLIRRSSGLVSWVDMSSASPVPRLVAITNVVAFGLRRPDPYYSTEPKWQFVRSDGRVFEGTSAFDVISPRAGFDR
jgi:hypothetical protein